MQRTSPDQPVVPTTSIIAYLAVIYAWLFELIVLLIDIVGKKKFDPLGHAALIVLAGALSAFAYSRGKVDFARLRHTRGQIPLTSSQIWIITSILVSFCLVIAIIAMRMTINWN